MIRSQKPLKASFHKTSKLIWPYGLVNTILVQPDIPAYWSARRFRNAAREACIQHSLPYSLFVVFRNAYESKDQNIIKIFSLKLFMRISVTLKASTSYSPPPPKNGSEPRLTYIVVYFVSLHFGLNKDVVVQCLLHVHLFGCPAGLFYNVIEFTVWP